MKLLIKKANAIELDASKFTYGRLCAKIACILMGKYNIYMSPDENTGSVIIKNLYQVYFTGKNKINNIKHYWHTGYAKGLRYATIGSYIQKNRLIDYVRISVYKMMSKTHFNKNYIYKNVKEI